MSVYRRDDPYLLSKAIQSVKKNSLQPSQFLIVIDGPIDDVLESILSDAKEKLSYVELLYLPSNLGLALALNHGLKKVKFPWVVRADADDINHENRFCILAKEIAKDPTVDLLGSSVVEFDESYRPVFYKSPPLGSEEIKKFIRYRNPFNHMSVVFRLDKVVQVGGYPNIYLKEDYGLWALLISMNAKVKNISDVLVSVNAGEGMYARRGGFSYAKSEIQLQAFLIGCGIQSFILGLLIGVIRSAVFLMPNCLRGFIYKRFLRRNI